MKKKKTFKELESFLRIPTKPKETEGLSLFNNQDSLKEILELIVSYEKQAMESDMNEELLVFLSKLSKLKIKMLHSLKKKQHQLLDLHWKKIKEENVQFLKNMNEQLAIFKKYFPDKNLVKLSK